MKVGAIIMFLTTVSLNLNLLSIMNLHNGFTANILDVVGETVRMALGAGVMGAVLGLMDKGKGVALYTDPDRVKIIEQI